MALHEGGDGGLRTELAMFAPALPAPVGLADGEDAAPPRAVVIPAPNDDGLLETFDGRKHRIADAAALAAAIGAQPVQVRVDTDHQSEPVSPTWRGSTHACGWLTDFRAEPTGAITAAFDLDIVGESLLRSGTYRYLSPALTVRKSDDAVMGLSSVALLNNPNMPLEAPQVHNNQKQTDTKSDEQTQTQTAGGDAASREAALAAREAALDARELHAATAAVDRAVETKRILPAQKEFYLAAVRNDPAGIPAGLAAFEGALHAGPMPAPPPQDLDRRIGPTGQPPQTAPAAPEMAIMDGTVMTDDRDRLTMHARIAAHAREQKVSYGDALLTLYGG